ncbi:MAG: transposase [Deltaproteobacteria bacterium]|nr:transposase [Deltaproteobacteria bacterium]
MLFSKQFPEAVECLERGFDDAPTYFACPRRTRIRTTNGLERLHGEIKRRTDRGPGELEAPGYPTLFTRTKPNRLRQAHPCDAQYDCDVLLDSLAT